MTDHGGPPSVDPDELVDEQMAYYRARAPEYDEWWLRQGLHDRGPEFAAAWDREVRLVLGHVASFSATGHVLELAAGTGNFTRELVRTASSVTAVDASSEALAIARDKVDAAASSCPVEYVVDDLFGWQPPRRYDVVFFSFWLSHVPPARYDRFWELVADSLQPDGRVCFVDNAPGGDRTGDNATTVRVLNDGSRFTIVKRFWEPAELESVLDGLGWIATVRATPTFFIHGTAVRG